jgi:hypothetical protein
MKAIATLFILNLAFMPLQAADEAAPKPETPATAAPDAGAPQPGDQQSPAGQLCDALNLEATAMESAKASFKPALEQIRELGVPQKGLDEIAAAAEKFFRKCLTGPGMRQAMIGLYEKHFTPDEIKAMLAFYQTPVGRKTVQLMPEIMGEATAFGQQEAEKNSRAFQAEIQAIIERFQPADDSESAPGKDAGDNAKALEKMAPPAH